MLSFSTMLIFSAAALVLTVTLGPDMLLIASSSVSQGKRAGFATLSGIMAGTYCHALAAALGLSQLLLRLPFAFDLLRLAGAAYLLYLAWKTFRSKAAVFCPNASMPKISARQAFLRGLLTNLFNPKMMLFVLALFPQFVRPEAGAVAMQIMLLATVLNLIGLLVNGVVIFAAGKLSTLRSDRPNTWPQYLLSLVFAGLAARLMIL
ncbi:MAG: hypothetical protein RL571_1940 [Pseudomonadota bacterium]|jgi:threonine/homoserine/homoserine lactone efflux protein